MSSSLLELDEARRALVETPGCATVRLGAPGGIPGRFALSLCLPDSADPVEMAEAIRAGDAERAAAAGMTHLTRLDDTIEGIKADRAAYFDDLD